MSAVNKIIVNIIGDSNVGKSTYIHRHYTGHFLQEETKGENKEVTLPFYTNFGIIDTLCVESGGESVERGERGESVEGKADATIVMFDVTDFESFRFACKLVEKLQSQDKLLVLCGNKVDCKARIVSPQHISTYLGNLDRRPQYYDISAKSSYNFEKPFVWILRQLISNDLMFVAIDDVPQD